MCSSSEDPSFTFPLLDRRGVRPPRRTDGVVDPSADDWFCSGTSSPPIFILLLSQQGWHWELPGFILVRERAAKGEWPLLRSSVKATLPSEMRLGFGLRAEFSAFDEFLVPVEVVGSQGIQQTAGIVVLCGKLAGIFHPSGRVRCSRIIA